MFQQLSVIGNVGKDAPEVKTFEDGSSLTKFSMATKKTWKDKQGQKQEKTTWHPVTVRGNLQNVCQFIHPGSKLAVTGEVEIQERDLNVNGQIVKMKYYGVGAQTITLLDTKADSAKTAPMQAAPVQQVPMQAAPVQQAAPQPVVQQAPPVQQPPVQQVAPVQQPPVQQVAPVQQVPMQAAPVVHSTPMQAMPVQQAPMQAAPMMQAPPVAAQAGYTNGAGDDEIPF